MRLSVAGAVVLAAGPVSAEPWQGVWTADPDWCVNADRIGSVTPAPIALTETEFLGYENSCDLTGVQKVTENGWKIVMACMSEGSTYDDERIVMVVGDTMYMWDGTEKPVQFTRCAP